MDQNGVRRAIAKLHGLQKALGATENISLLEAFMTNGLPAANNHFGSDANCDKTRGYHQAISFTQEKLTNSFEKSWKTQKL